MKTMKKIEFPMERIARNLKHSGIETNIIPVLIAERTKKPSF
jgi:hypothetical protein